MEKKELLTRLESLQQELLEQADVDQNTLDDLGTLVTTMNSLVEHHSSANRNSKETASLRHRLVNQIEQFETNHPFVTKFLSQMTDFLGMMGI